MLRVLFIFQTLQETNDLTTTIMKCNENMDTNL